jgi:Lon protease-like protein
MPEAQHKFSGQAPIFALPSVILVPEGEQILHVFEERYRAMLAHALAGERLIAIAMIDPSRAARSGAPAVHEIVGLGRIVEHQELPGGRSLILLKGVGRYRILAEDRSRPFRIARLEPLARECADPVAAVAAARELLERLRCRDVPVELLDPGQAVDAAERIADQLLDRLQLAPAMRQQVFGIADVTARLTALHRLLDQVEIAVRPSCN